MYDVKIGKILKNKIWFQHLNKKYKVNVPLVLMNSFNTDEDTEKIIRKYKGLQLTIYTFNQSCYPRINRDTLLPLATSSEVEKNLDAWYPPGHGDFYSSFKESGLLEKFIETGREYCFISNIDNLGATIDLNILGLVLNTQNTGREPPEFVMEVTGKTRADVKVLCVFCSVFQVLMRFHFILYNLFTGRYSHSV